MAKDFEDLYFYDRPDLTPYLIHLTRNTNNDYGNTAFDNLVSILKDGQVIGSGNTGFIKGNQKATCFMDVPFVSLKYLLNEENADPDDPRYEAYGVVISKPFGYKKGCRPVLYLSNQEIEDLNIPKHELWRVVRFEQNDEGWISWLHEREWRKKGNFKLPTNPIVVVKYANEVKKLNELIQNDPTEFKCKPRAILPLSVVYQGLLI